MVSYTIKQTVVENLNADLDGKQPAGDYPTNASLTESLQSNLLNYTTNRILEIPQDIKLELNNGTLTLKAGSKVYVPNGFEADGTTPKFDVVTIENDISGTSEFGRPDCVVVYSLDGNLNWDNGAKSGASSETAGIFYNTTTNLITSTSGWFTGNASLPVCVITENTSGSGLGVKSIDQVFNGFGYIGSTVFVLPGIKVQIPNGRNDDGSCKNRLYTETSVKTFTTNSDWGAGVLHGYIGDLAEYGGSQYDFFPAMDSVTKPSEKNMYLDTVTGRYNSWCPVVSFYQDSTGKITSFTHFTVDSVVNSNASNFSQAGRSYLFGLSMPSGKYIDLTLGASGSTYTAPANGWFSIQVEVSGNNQFFSSVVSVAVRDYGFAIPIWTGGGSIPVRVIVPCLAGCIFKTNYNCTINSVTEFRFIYAQGEQ